MTETREPSGEPRFETESAKDLFPYLEDWIALQGGRPRVFRNPRKPESGWLVVHVYEDHPDATHRFQKGYVIPTLPHKGGIPMSRLHIKRQSFEFEDKIIEIEHDIKIPSFMNVNVHGDPCNGRSALLGGSPYERIRNQQQYEGYLKDLRERGFEELRFGVNDEGFTLTPIPDVRPPRPLKEN